eukprot:TRINITY_DN6265_c0_g1_i1.p1 TRINITY_DN6265_c0_g1~~TRINITY_DN6265_c0_g1_i1.p1  ORF type:complete len:530 (-),score=73.34 TRINITY_DN6265_c0_g1_i1:66-1655(-)
MAPAQRDGSDYDGVSSPEATQAVDFPTWRCELAATRLQRWSRASRWRRRVLPYQLLRARVLLHSCLAIQRWWRNVAATASCWPPNSARVVSTAGAAVGDVGTWPAGGGELEPQRRRPSNGDVEDPRSASSASSSSVREPAAAEEASPGCRRLAALWRGWRVRRALASRAVQQKLRMRHELYQLILDAEGPSTGTQDRRDARDPWMSSLYSEVERLRDEVLREFESALVARVATGGGTPHAARSSATLAWRGWPRDLQRYPQLALKGMGTQATAAASADASTGAGQLASFPSVRSLDGEAALRGNDATSDVGVRLGSLSSNHSQVLSGAGSPGADAVHRDSNIDDLDQISMIAAQAALSTLQPSSPPSDASFDDHASGAKTHASPAVAKRPLRNTRDSSPATSLAELRARRSANWSQVPPRVQCWDSKHLPPSGRRQRLGSSGAVSQSRNGTPQLPSRGPVRVCPGEATPVPSVPSSPVLSSHASAPSTPSMASYALPTADNEFTWHESFAAHSKTSPSPSVPSTPEMAR